MDDQKEYYRLWWEYLRRSARYKDYCEKYGTPEQYYAQDMDFLYGEHGNLWAPPFNDCGEWCRYKLSSDVVTAIWRPNEPPQKIEKAPPTTKIEYADKYFLENFFKAGYRLRRKLNREPTLREFQDFFLNPDNRESVYQTIPGSAFVVEPVLETTNKEMLADIGEFRKGSAVRKKTIKYDELQIYLEVYDLYNEYEDPHEVIRRHSWPDYDPDTTENADTLQREYRLYREKAARIIQNVESNHFPGEY